MWFKLKNQQVELTILVKPNAKKSAFLGISEQGLLISLHAKPHDGEANLELNAFLATFFHVPKSQVKLQRGERSRHKNVLLPLTEDVRKFIADNQ